MECVLFICAGIGSSDPSASSVASLLDKLKTVTQLDAQKDMICWVLQVIDRSAYCSSEIPLETIGCLKFLVLIDIELELEANEVYFKKKKNLIISE